MPPRDHPEVLAGAQCATLAGEMIRMAVLPFAIAPGIISAAMPGLGRAVGGTIAVADPPQLFRDSTGASPEPGGKFNSFAANIAPKCGTRPDRSVLGVDPGGLTLFIITLVVTASRPCDHRLSHKDSPERNPRA